jgi:hypothetical protein
MAAPTRKFPGYEAREDEEVSWTTVNGSEQYYRSGDKAVVVVLNRAYDKQKGTLYGIRISYPNRVLNLSLGDGQKLKVALDNILRFAKEKEGIKVNTVV